MHFLFNKTTLHVFVTYLTVTLYVNLCNSTGLFEMIVGVLITCHTQYSWDSSICFLFNRPTRQAFVNTLQVLYMCTLCDSTGLFKMFVGVLTTCRTKYTWDSSICVFLFNTTALQVLLHTLQVIYVYTLCVSTGLFEMIVRVLPTCNNTLEIGVNVCLN